MRIKHALSVLALVVLGAWLGVGAFAQRGPASRSSTGDIAAAAKKFLASLDDAQRGRLIFDFKDEAQRRRWSNFPVGIFERSGLRLGELTPPQRDAAMAVLAAALSKQGYEKVLQIVEADEVLKIGDAGAQRGPGAPNDRGGAGPRDGRGDRGGPGGRGGRGGRGGGGLNFGRDLYFISFLGQPSPTEPWIIQFGGHHLGINITLAGEQGSLSPSHTGAQPAIYQVEGKTIRPLGREVDKAFALISSMDESQRKQAILGFDIRDLVLGPGRDGQTIAPEGIKAASLSDKQREMLLDIASEWTGILHESAADAKMEQMRKDINETYFAWSGATEKDAPAYFRIQGPTVLIEFAPQRMGGDANRHIHTIYRDPTNEYGAKWPKP